MTLQWVQSLVTAVTRRKFLSLFVIHLLLLGAIAGWSNNQTALQAAPTAGDTCVDASASPLVGTLPIGPISDTTIGQTDDYDLPADVADPTCTAPTNGVGGGTPPRGAIYTGTGTGPDRAFSIATDQSCTLQIAMTPTGAQDLSLIVYESVCSSSLNDCVVVDDTGVGGIAEQVSIDALAGIEYFIVVDGYSSSSGPFDLSISETTATGCQLVDPVYGVDLSADDTQAGDVGTTVSYEVAITNTGNVADSFALTVNNNNWNTTGVPAAPAIAAGETVTFTVNVEVPANATQFESDEVILFATSIGDGTETDTINLITTVSPPAITTSHTELNLTLAPDELGNVMFAIGNTGGSGLDWLFYEAASLRRAASAIAFSNRATTEPAAETAANAITAPSSAVAPLVQDVAVYAPTAVLYDNGPLVNSPSTGAGGADESVLQNTSLGMSIFGFAHVSNSGFTIADDFTIPNGENWRLDTVTFFAYQTNSPITSTITGYAYNVYDGQPGAGGNIIFSGNTLVSTQWSGIYRTLESAPGATDRPIMASTVDFGGLLLPSGTYWIEWVASGSLVSGPWAPPIAISGTTNTGNALQSTSGTWGAALDVGQQGFPFIIEGSIACTADVPWLSVATSSGNTTPGSNSQTAVNFNATGQNPGVYTGTLCLSNTDPNSLLIEIPVTMTVENPTIYLPFINRP
ncbi:MAG: hypothetical protein OT477_04425 [Chloroflexi bacterium]|nr:hypothetical protein [Chloroflexota bacterium]